MQMLRNFNITLNVSKKLPSKKFLHTRLFFHFQRTFKGKVFSGTTFDWCFSSKETPPLTLPHLNDSGSFLSYVHSTDLFLLSLLNSLFSFNISWGRVCFLTLTVVIITSYSFKNSVTIVPNSIYTETIIFLLSTNSNITLNSTVWLSCLKKWETRFLERARFVLAWCGVELLVSVAISHLVYKPVVLAWHIEEG